MGSPRACGSGVVIISVFNCSNGKVADSDMQKVIRAINVQIARDFEPYWSFGATLRLEGHTRQPKPRKRPYSAADMRGDAVPISGTTCRRITRGCTTAIS